MRAWLLATCTVCLAPGVWSQASPVAAQESVSTAGAAHGRAAAPRLMAATKIGSAEGIRAALAAGEDVNATQADGTTALHWAAHHDDVATADVLLKAGAHANVANELGATPLWLAAVNGSERMIASLLDAGADPNPHLESGETPLMAAARSGNVAVVRRLATAGAAVDAREHLRGQTALMWAADQQHPAVVRALIDAGADVRARSATWRQLENTAGNTNDKGDFEVEHGGSTALLFAARRGDIESARVLLQAGANVDDANAAGASALVIAAHSGHGAFARALLDHGADPNAAGAGYSALHAAVLRGDLALVEALVERRADVQALVRHGSPVRRLSADYSIRWQMIGVNAAWIAARLGHPRILKVLLDAGASVTPLPQDGTTALKAAMGYVTGVTENREGRYGAPMLDHAVEEQLTLAIARMLVERGADVNAANAAGDTALHDAVRQRFNAVIEFLVANGARVNARNKRDQTPLMVVRAEVREAPPDSPLLDRQATIALLQKLGAE